MSSQRVNSMASSRIPYATEQGISKRVSGNFFRVTGNFNRGSKRPLFDAVASVRARPRERFSHPALAEIWHEIVSAVNRIAPGVRKPQLNND
jgi:hypothetical protein